MSKQHRTSAQRRTILATAGVLVLLVLTACATAVLVDATTQARVSGEGGAVQTALGAADGVIDDDTPLTAWSDEPAVAKLDPALRAAVQSAAEAAEADGVVFAVTSGWRSPRYQEQLLDQAVRDYGSLEEAAKWVADAKRSSHVHGLAVDIGPTDADSWLQQHGAEYGLCQTYANEMWHFELRDLDADGFCPQPYADPTEDPRLRD